MLEPTLAGNVASGFDLKSLTETANPAMSIANSRPACNWSVVNIKLSHWLLLKKLTWNASKKPTTLLSFTIGELTPNLRMRPTGNTETSWVRRISSKILTS